MTEGLTNGDKTKIKAWFTSKLKPATNRKPLTTHDLNTLLTQSLDKLSDTNKDYFEQLIKSLPHTE